MIRPEALTRLRLLVGAVRAPPVASEHNRELPPLLPGQPIDGRVEQQSRATYIVSVRGRSYDLKLPEGTRPGDFLRMVYVNDQPRPTFALLRIERASEQAESKLSDAGRFLAMLQDVEFEAIEQPATAPVFQSRVPPTAQAAILLREALAFSGLFYESHQAQWILGTRSTAQLKREPQGKLAPIHSPAIELPELPASQVSEDAMQFTPAATTRAAPETETQMPPQPEQNDRSPAHPDSFPIIRQQLSALESGHVAWRGIVWPGQELQWRVGNDASAKREHSEMPTTWCTELKLNLPNVGELLARIELGANGAKLRILADSEQHARQLREQAPALAIRFGTAGIPIHALEVSHGSEAI